ncbi:hypothetical protein PGB90_006526 [Kerria lacca]
MKRNDDNHDDNEEQSNTNEKNEMVNAVLKKVKRLCNETLVAMKTPTDFFPKVEETEKLKKSFFYRWNMKLSNTASLDDFTIMKTIGVGSFGHVFCSLYKKTKTPYAIKVLNKEQMVRMQQVDRVQKQILQSVKNTFLIDLRFVFKTNSNLFLVMPLVKGGDLYTHMQMYSEFLRDERCIRFYAAQVILAFEYLHAMNIIYRDLKPENILLECDGYIRIADFGFAKFISTTNNKKALTKSFIGTPEYMAPEMLISTERKKGYTFSVDWWSLGILVYELKTGNPPFLNDNLIQMFDHIIKGKYSTPKNFDETLSDLLKKMLHVRVNMRLGCGKLGSQEIKFHSWFSKVNWDAIRNKTETAYFVPNCTSAYLVQMKNFFQYPEILIKENDQEEYSSLFKNF